jgi:hypothetical protein
LSVILMIDLIGIHFVGFRINKSPESLASNIK